MAVDPRQEPAGRGLRRSDGVSLCATGGDQRGGQENALNGRRQGWTPRDARTRPWLVRPKVLTCSGRFGSGSAGWMISDTVEASFIRTSHPFVERPRSTMRIFSAANVYQSWSVPQHNLPRRRILDQRVQHHLDALHPLLDQLAQPLVLAKARQSEKSRSPAAPPLVAAVEVTWH